MKQMQLHIHRRTTVSLLFFALLYCCAFSYGLQGYWDMSPSPGQYQSISDSLTFQFKRDVDQNGKIVSNLNIYNCFLSKFLYEISQKQIWFSFKSSILLTDNCSISQINQIKKLLQKVFFYEIKYDRLRLLDPKGASVFSMVRQKIDYKSMILGVWQLFTPEVTASTLTYINGSSIFMCRDSSIFNYGLITINGSYPQISITAEKNILCADIQFVKAMAKTSFFQVAANRSQLILFDKNGLYLTSMNLEGKIPYSQQLNSNQASIKATSTSTTTSNVSGTIIINTKNNGNNIQNVQSNLSMNNQNNGQQTNQQSYQTAIKSSTTSQLQVQTPSQVVQSPISQLSTNSQNENSQIYIPQASSKAIPVPVQQISSSTVSSKQTITTQTYKPSLSVQPDPIPSSPVSTIQTTSNVNSNSNTQSAPTSTSFNFQNSYQFYGSFSYQPLFTSASSITNQQTVPSSNQNNNPQTISSNISSSDQNSESSAPAQFNFNPSDFFMNDFSFIPQSDNFAAKTDPTPQQSNAQSLNFTADFSSLASAGNMTFQSSLNLQVPLSDFIQQGKWIIYWLNGVNIIPSYLSRVYIYFTATKIILYCPCNTYYTNYFLVGNSLKGIQWMGTQNQCDNNKDKQITSFIFYANRISNVGEDIIFWYNTQAKLAQFQPYF